MFWADTLTQQLDKSKKQRVDDMKTPSGHAHAGSLRAISTHGILYEAMKLAGFNVDFTYVVNNMDPMDGMPRYLDPEVYNQHMGKPLYTIPAPDGKSANFAEQYAKEYIGAFNALGFKPQIFWSKDLYAQGLFDEYIRLVLDNVEVIRKIYKDIANQSKPEGWYPFQVICPNCGKVGCNLVTGWDGKEVTYECKPDLVEWAVGCGHKGKISPFGGTGKLMWKPDWAAHWAVLNISVEGAGKDHFSKGGSRYVAAAIMQQVFKMEPPFGFLHEFLLIGGAKMSSSKGNATSAADLVSILPPELGRFLFVRTPYQRAINFDPFVSTTIPDLFDEYDRCAEAWFVSGAETDFGRYYQASQLSSPEQSKLFLPRFRQIATLMQMPSVDIVNYFTNEKGSALSKTEQAILDVRLKYAKIWLDKFAGEEDKFSFSDTLPDKAKELTVAQRDFLGLLAADLEQNTYPTADELQQHIFEFGKQHNLPSKKVFQAIYLIFINKDHGPKAGWLLFEKMKQDQAFVINRLQQVAADSNTKVISTAKYSDLNRPELLSIDTAAKTKWPSLIVGYAEIKGVKIVKSLPELEQLKLNYLEQFRQITRKQINEFPEIQSYRKLYKDMGIDWHSRRPSPEALLRRLTQGKDLYTVNSLVDAYNLIVMKYRVSIGAFDRDNLILPLILKQAQGDESILLLGDTEGTQIKQGELCYFDQQGPYNLDFNYRDADRSKVTANTTSVILNIDGAYNINREQIERSLSESIELITKFCGGEVVTCGIVQ